MMSYSDNLEKAIRTIQELIPDVAIEWEQHDFGGKIHTFFIHPKDEKVLNDTWEKITSAIAGNFQTLLETDFEIWNIYLFFLLNKLVGPQIKYKIENDTFSSRKIIIEKEQTHEQILIDHIFNSNLGFEEKGNKTSTAVAEFDYNNNIKEVVEGKTLKKSKRTPEADTAFDKLTSSLRDKK